MMWKVTSFHRNWHLWKLFAHHKKDIITLSCFSLYLYWGYWIEKCFYFVRYKCMNRHPDQKCNNLIVFFRSIKKYTLQNIYQSFTCGSLCKANCKPNIFEGPSANSQRMHIICIFIKFLRKFKKKLNVKIGIMRKRVCLPLLYKVTKR